MTSLWGSVKYYAQTSYYLALAYGRVRGLVQPWVSTEFNVNQIEDGVYIGDIASAYNEKELKNLGITHIITAVLGVHPESSFSDPKAFKYLNVPVRDVNGENMKQHLPTTNAFIEEALLSGGKVLVHCVCGVSRSATIVAAWIMSKHGYGVEETIDLLKSRRGCVNPIPAFREQLQYLSELAQVPETDD